MARTITRTQKRVYSEPDVDNEEVIVDDEPVSVTSTPSEFYAFSNFINYLLGIVEGLLVLRFLFRFLGANPNAGFTQLIYSLTAPLMAPFQNIFRPAVANGSVFDTSILVAMLVYLIIAQAIIQLLSLLTTRTTTPA